jgi:fatty aldehyde decarbonylase
MEQVEITNELLTIPEQKPEFQLPITSDHDRVFADLLSQAVTGELIGMSNFASLVGLHDDLSEKLEALDHAQSERAHADAFRSAAKRLGIPVIVDLKAPYWDRIRTAFLRRVELKDIIGTTIIQEVMLESFAITLYRHVARSVVYRSCS